MDFIDLIKERGIDGINNLYDWQPDILKHLPFNDIFNLKYSEVENIIHRFPDMKEFFEDINYL